MIRYDIVTHRRDVRIRNNESNWGFRDNGIVGRSVYCVGTFWVGVDELWILIDAVSRSGLRSVKGVGSCKPIVVPGFNGDV